MATQLCGTKSKPAALWRTVLRRLAIGGTFGSFFLMMGCRGPETVSPPSGPALPSINAVSPRPEATLEPPVSRQPPAALDAVPTVPLEDLLSPQAGRTQGFYYEAQIGDTLNSVARRYGLAPAKLRQANGLDLETTPRSGQLLFVPAQQAIHGSNR